MPPSEPLEPDVPGSPQIAKTRPARPPVPRREGSESVTPEYATEEIFRGSRMVRIRHAGEEYRLQITRNNRLILQK